MAWLAVGCAVVVAVIGFSLGYMFASRLYLAAAQRVLRTNAKCPACGHTIVWRTSAE